MTIDPGTPLRFSHRERVETCMAIVHRIRAVADALRDSIKIAAEPHTDFITRTELTDYIGELADDCFDDLEVVHAFLAGKPVRT